MYTDSLTEKKLSSAGPGNKENLNLTIKKLLKIVQTNKRRNNKWIDADCQSVNYAVCKIKGNN